MRKETKEKIESVVNDKGYDLVKIYMKDDKVRIIVSHKDCGFEWDVQWSNFYKRKSECKNCGSKFFPTIEKCKEYAQGRGYILLSDEYMNGSVKMSFECIQCNNVFQMKWNHFYNGEHGCPYCSKHFPVGIENCKKKAEVEGYTILSENYINAHIKMAFRHDFCGYEFDMDWSSFDHKGSRCPKCMKRAKPTLQTIRIFCKDAGYVFLSKKYDLKEKLKFKHISCGYIFKTTWNSFQQGHRCPKCKRSSMERIIEDFLIEKNFKKEVDYFVNFRFSDCRDKQPLPFDFYFPNHNILCECQGKQHYELNDFWKKRVDLEDRKKKDNIKKEYALNNGYIFLEIPYWEKKNIIEIIIKELNIQ